jgi:hypothetical protein
MEDEFSVSDDGRFVGMIQFVGFLAIHFLTISFLNFEINKLLNFFCIIDMMAQTNRVTKGYMTAMVEHTFLIM